MKNSIGILTFLIFLLFSCKEEESPKPLIPASSPVIVLNEGNFRSGNASISLFDASNSSVQNKVFQNNNQGRPLGDVAQSMIEWQDKGYVVVNNSNKIEVINLENFQSLGQITGLNSPRYILPVGGTKAYVSDLYQNQIYLIDLQSLAKLGTIETNGWVEQMILVGNNAFVSHVDSNQVWVIDTQKDSVISKIDVGISPNSLVQDASGNIWVSCSGGQAVDFPKLVQIDPQTFQLTKTLTLSDKNRGMSSLCKSPDGQLLYYLSGDFYRLNIQDSLLPASPLIQASGRLFYKAAVHPASGEIYLTDAIDYTQAGVLIRHSAEGNEINVARVGLIPGYIHFR